MKYILLILFLMVSACNESSDDKETINKQNYLSGQLTYFKDKHNICYAMISGDSRTLTSVPCDNIGL